MISPEGEFFKIYPKDKLETGHDNFAEYYVRYKYKKDIYEECKIIEEFNLKAKDLKSSPKEILIHCYGFVNYEYGVNGLGITVPDVKYKGNKITNKQIEIILH